MPEGAAVTMSAAAGPAVPRRWWGRCWLLTARVCDVCRASKWGALAAFTGCGAPEEEEAWTFKCPPGHRIVGYAGRALRWVECVCFLTAEFRDPAGSC
jgi:hypothetical protein